MTTISGGSEAEGVAEPDGALTKALAGIRPASEHVAAAAGALGVDLRPRDDRETATSASATAPCAACRTVFPVDELEPVPADPDKLRCKDEDGCRKRYTPRKLRYSPHGPREESS